jgi:hypothetical protein
MSDINFSDVYVFRYFRCLHKKEPQTVNGHGTVTQDLVPVEQKISVIWHENALSNLYICNENGDRGGSPLELRAQDDLDMFVGVNRRFVGGVPHRLLPLLFIFVRRTKWTRFVCNYGRGDD